MTIMSPLLTVAIVSVGLSARAAMVDAKSAATRPPM